MIVTSIIISSGKQTFLDLRVENNEIIYIYIYLVLYIYIYIKPSQPLTGWYFVVHKYCLSL